MEALAAGESPAKDYTGETMKTYPTMSTQAEVANIAMDTVLALTEKLQQMEERAVAAENRWIDAMQALDETAASLSDGITTDFESGIHGGWVRAHRRMMAINPDLSAAREMIAKADAFEEIVKHFNPDADWITDPSAVPSMVRDQTFRNRELTDSITTLRRQLQESEALGERMRDALKEISDYVEETARDSFGHPDYPFEHSFLTEDPEGFGAWLVATATLTLTPAAALSGYRVSVLADFLRRQQTFSAATFGPGKRTKGLIDHITKELKEIEADPTDLSEFIDVILLAFDGFWRHGGKPEELLPALEAKLAKNTARTWPKPTSEDQAIEHVRDAAEIRAMKEAK